MPYYKKQYYNSKAAVVRAMYADGSMTTSPEDKRRVAKELGMTVQTVHATIVKLMKKTLAPKTVAKFVKPPQVKRPVKTTQTVATGNRFETIQLIRDKFDECYEIAKAKGKDLPKIDIRFDLKGTCGGQFCTKYGHRYFRINVELAHANIDDYLSQTVPHEFAHYIQRMDDMKSFGRSKPHGYEWKMIMIQYFGLSPDRCHNYDTNEIKKRRRGSQIYKCGCQTFVFGPVKHQNAQRGSRYSCRKCRETLVWAKDA